MARTTDTTEQAVSDLMLRLGPDGDGYVDGFRVVVERTVGEVRFGEGEKSPYQAAFEIIGGTGEEGVYRFPHEDGGHVVVSVEWGKP